MPRRDITVAGTAGTPTPDHGEREATAIRRLRERLVANDSYASEEVNAAVDRAVRVFAGAPVREFVPLLVERLAVDDLRRLIAATTDH